MWFKPKWVAEHESVDWYSSTNQVFKTKESAQLFIDLRINPIKSKVISETNQININE